MSLPIPKQSPSKAGSTKYPYLYTENPSVFVCQEFTRELLRNNIEYTYKGRVAPYQKKIGDPDCSYLVDYERHCLVVWSNNKKPIEKCIDSIWHTIRRKANFFQYTDYTLSRTPIKGLSNAVEVSISRQGPKGNICLSDRRYTI